MKKTMSFISALTLAGAAYAQDSESPKLLQEYNLIEFGPSMYIHDGAHELDHKMNVNFMRSITKNFYFQLGFSTANSQGEHDFSLNTLQYGVGYNEITDFGSGEIDTFISLNLMNIQDTQTDLTTYETTKSSYMGQQISVGLNTLMNTMPQIVTTMAVNFTNIDSDGFALSYEIAGGYDFNQYLQLRTHIELGSQDNTAVGIAIRRKF